MILVFQICLEMVLKIYYDTVESQPCILRSPVFAPGSGGISVVVSDNASSKGSVSSPLLSAKVSLEASTVVVSVEASSLADVRQSKTDKITGSRPHFEHMVSARAALRLDAKLFTRTPQHFKNAHAAAAPLSSSSSLSIDRYGLTVGFMGAAYRMSQVPMLSTRIFLLKYMLRVQFKLS